MRAHDWSASPLGDPALWPQSLRSVVGLLLGSKFPMFVAWGPELGFLYNDAYAEILGEKHPAALGARFADAWADAWADLRPLVDASLNGEASYFENWPLRTTRRGYDEQTWFTFSYSPVHDEGGSVAGMFCACSETTAQVLADRRAAEVQERQRQMLRQMPGFVGMLSGPDLVYTYVNDAYIAISERTDFVGRRFRDVFADIEGQGYFEMFENAFHSGKGVVIRGMELRLHGRDDPQYVDFVLEPIRDDAGVVTGLFVGGYETTDIYRGNQVLRESEARQRFLLDIANAMHGLTSPAEIMAVVAERLGPHMGVDQANYYLIEGDRFIVTEEWRTSASPGVRGSHLLSDFGASTIALQQSGRAQRLDDTRGVDGADAFAAAGMAAVLAVPLRRDGRWAGGLHVHQARPRTWTDGEETLLREVAERTWAAMEQARAEADLRELNATLETRVAEAIAEREVAEDALRQSQKMEAVGQLTGGVAHDFNNMLTIIKSSTDLLRRPDLPEERRRRYVGAISDTVDRASKLTGQLLAFARRQALKPEVFDVRERIEAISDMLRTIVGARIQLVTDVFCQPCFVGADVSQFETALVNMAVNARDAMDGEGTLAVTVRSLPELPPLRGHAGGPGPYMALSITDTGTGIPPNQLSQIFEPFFTTKEVGKGTGLGLSQVYGFAKQSGGDVVVESEVGRGSTFTVYLPLVEAPPEVGRAPEQKGGRSHAGRGDRILVVEDNVEVGTFSTQLLQDLGYVTTWAANGADALKLLEERPDGFDAVFSDVVMPGMSGVDLGHEIRRRFPGLPVVLTSGYSHVLAAEGPHGFELLHKPYAVEDLSRILRRVIGSPAAL
jgi:signal transduction histidine kinase/PAS domain-containing protein